eukprot:365535-Chlamydomonas_euryale.AAC.42
MIETCGRAGAELFVVRQPLLRCGHNASSVWRGAASFPVTTPGIVQWCKGLAGQKDARVSFLASKLSCFKVTHFNEQLRSAKQRSLVARPRSGR